MKNFIFTQTTPKIFQTQPELERYVANNNMLENYPCIKEFACIEFTEIKLKSLDMHYNDGIEICYVHKGKYNWLIEDREYTLFPGDCFITFPWQKHGSPIGALDIGQIYWLIIQPKEFTDSGNLKLGYRTGFSAKEQNMIGTHLRNAGKQHFSDKKVKEDFDKLFDELQCDKFGQQQHINSLLDHLLILIVRSLTENSSTDSSKNVDKIFLLEQKLKNDLWHKWTIKEMADLIGIGQTSLNHLLKHETGYTPGQYIMDLRINAAKGRLMNSSDNITAIALDCGFSSSQHFSASFKQKTGYTPRDFRKNKILPSSSA